MSKEQMNDTYIPHKRNNTNKTDTDPLCNSGNLDTKADKVD